MSVILFDLSDVIIRGLKGTEDALSDDLQLPPEVIHRQFHDPEFHELFLGRIDERQYWQALLHRHRWNTTIDHLQQRARENMVELDGMFDLLDQLHQQGTTTALLSNHTAAWAEHMERRYPQLKTYFPIRLYSHELRLMKPDPLIYHLAADRLQHRPNEILFVDDHQPNLIGAASIGMRTLQFVTPRHLRQALMVMGYLTPKSVDSLTAR